jgi:DNA-binding NtrC family response regulator
VPVATLAQQVSASETARLRPPEDPESPIQWEEVVDLHVIKRLSLMINRRWSLGVGFANADGSRVTIPRTTDHCPTHALCRLVQGCSAGEGGCTQTGAQISRLLRDSHDALQPPASSLSYTCHAGLREIAVPVTLNGQYLGSVLAGGFLLRDGPEADEAEVQTRIAGYDLPPDEQARALKRQPRLSKEEVNYLTEVVELVAEEIVTFQGELRRRERRLDRLEKDLLARHSYDAIVGKSRTMQELYRLLDKVTVSESTVLIQGENGTGKELIARAIHAKSSRRDRPFVVQNCSAFNDNLLDSELFGHRRGSFTGAIADKQGLFEVADGGTFFLDEIGDMSPTLQVKVLRVLQEGTFIPVGDTRVRKVDVRIIAATNKDLKRMVERAEFREDLYYRVNVINLTVPPLRERPDDIPLLVDYFLKKNAKGRKLKQKRLTKECATRLLEYSWPGNIRELENEIERLVVLSGEDKVIGEELLSQRIRQQVLKDEMAGLHVASSLPDAVQALERNMIYEVLRRTHWNKTIAARELRISRRNLIRKVKHYKLDQRRSRRDA